LLANTPKKSEIKKWKKVTKNEEERSYIEASEKGKVGLSESRIQLPFQGINCPLASKRWLTPLPLRITPSRHILSIRPLRSTGFSVRDWQWSNWK
jgi:hypothetical protein